MTALPGTASEKHHKSLERLARRGTASVVGAACNAVLGLLLVVIITNGFSPSLAGTLFAVTSAFLILEAVAVLGTDTGVVRWLPTHLASGRSADIPRTLVVSAVPVLVFSVATGAALYAAAPSLAPHLFGTDAPETMTRMLRALALVLPVAALYTLVVAGTRGMRAMRPTVLIENVGRVGLQAAAVLGTYLAGGGALALTLAWSLPYVVGLVAAAWWLRALVKGGRPSSGAPVAPWGALVREFWGYTAPRALARITQTALKRSDIVLVATLASPADAALYTAATRFVVLGQLLVQSVQQALSPHLSALFARGETGTAQAVFQAATLWSMLAAWPIYLVTAALATPLMGLFGDGYGAASQVVVILSLTMLLATACGPVDSVLLMAGRSWLSLRNSTVALAVNLGLNVVLIPSAGIRGAATAWAAAIVVRNLLPLFQVRHDPGMWPVTSATGHLAIRALVCFGGAGLVVTLGDLPLALDLALLGVGLVAYLVGVWTHRTTLGLQSFRFALKGQPALATRSRRESDATSRL
jgi:O-antigen/teichoic acid export membrane protein